MTTALWLAPLLPLKADVSRSIAPLSTPTLDSAKSAITSLEAIARDTSNTESRTAATLSKAIKDAFTAEYNLQLSLSKLDAAFDEAQKLDQQAQIHLTPNTLGSINEIAAEEKLKSAAEIRSRALQNVRGSLDSMKGACAAWKSKTADLELSDEARGLLSGAIATVEQRSIPVAQSALEAGAQVGKDNITIIKSVAAARMRQAEAQKDKEAQIAQLRRIQRAAERAGDMEAVMQIQSRITALLSGSAGLAYLGNTQSNVVHDLNQATANCQINEIRSAGHAKQFSSLQEARSQGYRFCEYCLKP